MSTVRSIASKTAEHDSRPAWIILVAMIALTQFYYWTRADIIGVTTAGRTWVEMTRQPISMLGHNLAAGLILGLIPLLCARGLCGMGFRDLGLGIGRPKMGLIWLAVGIPVAILVSKLTSSQPEFRAVYPLDAGLTSQAGPFARHGGVGAPVPRDPALRVEGKIRFRQRQHHPDRLVGGGPFRSALCRNSLGHPRGTCVRRDRPANGIHLVCGDHSLGGRDGPGLVHRFLTCLQ